MKQATRWTNYLKSTIFPSAQFTDTSGKTSSMTKVLIIGSGNRDAAILAAQKQFGEDVYIIPQGEEEQYQFASDVIPFKPYTLINSHPLFKPPLTRQERRKLQRKNK